VGSACSPKLSTPGSEAGAGHDEAEPRRHPAGGLQQGDEPDHHRQSMRREAQRRREAAQVVDPRDNR